MFPVLLQIGPVIIYSLWLFTGIAFIASVFIFTSLAKTKRLHLNFIYTKSINILIFGLIGARIVFVAQHHYLYFPDLSIDSWLGLFYFWDKGLSFFGGILGIALALVYYSEKNKEQTRKWLDILTISTITGLVIGNLGRFLDGSSYGRETSLPWGVLFESPSIKYAVPIHPTQLYAALYSLIIASVLFFFFARSSFKSGIIALMGIISLSLMVFLEGFIRGDDVAVFLGLRIEQWGSLLFLIIAAGTCAYYGYNIRRNLSKTKNSLDANI